MQLCLTLLLTLHVMLVQFPSVCLLFIIAMLVKFLSICMSITVLVLVDLQCRPKGKTMITQENIDLQLEQEK